MQFIFNWRYDYDLKESHGNGYKPLHETNINFVPLGGAKYLMKYSNVYTDTRMRWTHSISYYGGIYRKYTIHFNIKNVNKHIYRLSNAYTIISY